MCVQVIIISILCSSTVAMRKYRRHKGPGAWAEILKGGLRCSSIIYNRLLSHTNF